MNACAKMPLAPIIERVARKSSSVSPENLTMTSVVIAQCGALSPEKIHLLFDTAPTCTCDSCGATFRKTLPDCSGKCHARVHLWNLRQIHARSFR